MPISWMRSADVYPDARYPPDDFIAFDGAEIVGGVYRISHSTQEGLWFWTMTVSRPGPSFNDRNGSEVRRGDAGRRVVEAYEAMLRGRETAAPFHLGESRPAVARVGVAVGEAEFPAHASSLLNSSTGALPA